MTTQVRDGLAERRLAFARGLGERGDWESACAILAETVNQAPRWDALRFAFAEALERHGRLKEARASYHAYLRLDPADAMGAAARLAVLGLAPTPGRLPAAYVRTLFDQYAHRFEHQLVNGLNYRGPEQLRAAVDAAKPPGPASERVLDWGCGTGLAGARFRNRAGWLEGVDLSPAMIARTRAKGLYDALHVQDILSPLPFETAAGEAANSGGAAGTRADGGAFDLIIAADVAAYVGDLRPMTARARALVAPGGLFAFTAEAADREGFSLGPGSRYAHHPAYIAAEAHRAGFTVRAMDSAACRQEAGRDVPSLIVVLDAR